MVAPRCFFLLTIDEAHLVAKFTGGGRRGYPRCHITFKQDPGCGRPRGTADP
ncbi:conserved hypothetical protein [Ricinus communis]|uniref:Uncharacterized protein n=1 Tax=Ricinus communis TaxID=3988 RepID=B9T2P0_RICCO|nr:conserved hypothetical protein [Ricinus communis]